MKTYRHFKFGGNIPPLTVTDKSDTPFLGRKIKIRGHILELSLYFTVHGVCSAVALATHTPVMMLQLVTHTPMLMLQLATRTPVMMLPLATHTPVMMLQLAHQHSRCSYVLVN